jgi:hypothetical protein
MGWGAVGNTAKGVSSAPNDIVVTITSEEPKEQFNQVALRWMLVDDRDEDGRSV